MNNFFKKPALIVLCSAITVSFLYVFIRFAILSFTPIAKIQGSVPSVERGSIVDRNGKPLAVQTNFYHVGVTPRSIKNKEQFIKDMASPLGFSQEQLKSIIDQGENYSFIYLKKKVDQTTYQELKKITTEKNYLYVTYDKIPGRLYPENSLASQLIGYMGDSCKPFSVITHITD